MYLSPTPVQQFFDSNGDLLIAGLLFCYAGGTSSTKQAAFTDSTGNTPLPNPVVLNTRAEVAPSATGTSCGLWLDPSLSYKLVLAPANDTDPPTNPIWTIDNVVSPQAAILAALAEYEASLTGVPIGGMLPFGGSSAPSGWLLCYGQAVSRSTYAQLFATIGVAYGIGDGTTTFNLPDKRGRVSVGKDDMGGSAANRVTNAVSGINANTLGASGGDQHAQQDTLAAVSTANIVVDDPGHIHNSQVATAATGGALSGLDATASAPSLATSPPTAEAFTGLTVSASVATTVTSSLTGASQNMPPAQVDNWIIFTGV